MVVCNGTRPYIMDGCVDRNNLPSRPDEADTERGVFMSKRNDFEFTGVKDVSHWNPGFDKKCGVSWGKLRGQLPAL
jgi:hypothetical protein